MIRRSRLARTSVAAAGLAVALAAGGCSSDLNPMRAVYASGDAKEVKAPDFVANSRKDGGDFMPVGVSAPARPIRAKSSEGTKTLAAELEGARGANEARGRAATSAGKATTPAKPPARPPADTSATPQE